MPKKKEKNGRKFLCGMLTAAVIGFSAASVGITVSQIPDEMTVYTAGKSNFDTFLPVEVDYTQTQSGEADAKLFGLLKVKEVNVSLQSPKRVHLCGNIFGVKMYSDGVMVVGLSDFASHGGSVNPARDAGISEGDIIKSVNGTEVSTNSEFSKCIQKSDGEIKLVVLTKNGQTKNVTLVPQYSVTDKCLKTGMWVRDSAAGIGTLTYIDTQSMTFGGLGHGICDADTQSIIPVQGGDIVEAEIINVKRGVKGAAGEIRGYLCNQKLGEITSNTICGTFGEYTGELPEGKDYEVALKQEIKTGKAQILCSIDGEEPKFYDISIDKINYKGSEPTKNMIITVTDEELIAKTGGIVQGMSGSPIVQNGKFVGAVTHVFVNDPTCGYGIFAENMINAANNAS